MIALEPIATSTIARIGSDLVGRLSQIDRKTSSRISRVDLEQAVQHRLRELRQVKTFWFDKEPKDIADFFIDRSFSTQLGAITARSLDDLPGRNILIEGHAGHGKSLFMRHACAIEQQLNRAFVAFVRLRDVSDEMSLMDLLVGYFSDLQADFSPRDVLDLIQRNNVSVFLDGFDEVPHNAQKATIEAINQMCHRAEFGDSRVIVSSRPRGRLQRSGYFRNLTLLPLSEEQAHELIWKLDPEGTLATSIIHQLRTSKNSDFEEMLTSPLLVTILLVIFKKTRRLPDNYC
ncbi:MAG: NACHT domain-containing protein [Planctomycetota bacterium]